MQNDVPLQYQLDAVRADERQAVIKEIEGLLVDEGGGETHNTTHDQQVRNQLRCKLLVKLQEMNEKV